MVCELKAAQTAVWLIRKYVADKPSGDAILAWLQPYEDFIFGENHDSDFINAHKNLSKSIIVRNELPWADEMVEKMVLLIKEELHHFYQVWKSCRRAVCPIARSPPAATPKGCCVK